jgi:2,3-dihydroxybenzoate decarboxylase
VIDPLTTGGQHGYLRIATEEAFAPPELLDRWRRMLAEDPDVDPGFRSLHGFYLTSDAERPRFIADRLTDLGRQRIADMDATGSTDRSSP